MFCKGWWRTAFPLEAKATDARPEKEFKETILKRIHLEAKENHVRNLRLRR